MSKNEQARHGLLPIKAKRINSPRKPTIEDNKSAMKMSASRKGSRQMAAVKGLLPFMATAAIAGGVDAGLGSGALAQLTTTITYDNTIYSLETTTCFAQGKTIISLCSGAKDFRTSSWFGNSKLAEDLSNATKDLLGLKNPALGANLGANFVWSSGDVATYNSTALPFDGFEWDPIIDKSYRSGGLWNSETGKGTRSTYWIAIETAPPQPITTLGPILLSNDGTSINTTLGLAGKQVLPQFQGGTLKVSAPSSIGDNFTVNDSKSNAIDAAGNSATFTGNFTNQVGQQGNLVFRNSGTSAAITTLTGQNSYTGSTTVESGTLVINGTSSSSTTVWSGATLGGSGAITGNVTNSGTVSGRVPSRGVNPEARLP
jgi:autotransporter-associated beta strand protein